MQYKSSIRAEKKRSNKLQVQAKRRNKAGQFVAKLIIKMRNKRVNGKAGRYAVTQG